MRILATSDDWTHLIDRHGKQHVVQRGCTYPPGVAAPPPCEHTHSSRVASSLTFYHGDRGPSRCNGCANLRRFRLSDEVAPYTRREQARIVESLLASNVSLEGML